MKANFGKQIKWVFLTFLIVSFVGLTSCDETEECPDVPVVVPATYTIKGQVTDQGTTTALSGVLVTMGTLTKTTDASGNFEFANLSTAGLYTLVFTKANYYSATCIINFPAAQDNQTVVYTVKISMAPVPPAVTDPITVTGGTVNVTGSTSTTLAIPANTTVTDASGKTVTGTINITAAVVPDVVVPNEVNNPGLFVVNLEPSGYQFNKALTLNVKNPLTKFRCSPVRLEYFNTATGKWELQTQAVTYDASKNNYVTTVTHFSTYKIAFSVPVESLAPTEKKLYVTDSMIVNQSLVNLNVTKINYKRNSGYTYETPIATVLANAGFTGADATEMASEIDKMVKTHYNGIAPLSQFAIVNDQLAVNRVVIPSYILKVSATQKILTEKFTIQMVNLTTNTAFNFTFNTKVADYVSFKFEDVSIEDHIHGHDHGSGGGGTL